MLRMLLVNKEGYQKAIDNLMASQQVSTRTDYVLTSQNWDKVYESHRASMTTGSSDSRLNVGNFTSFTNSRLESLNERIQREVDRAEMRPDVGRFGDKFDLGFDDVGMGGAGGSDDLLGRNAPFTNPGPGNMRIEAPSKDTILKPIAIEKVPANSMLNKEVATMNINQNAAIVLSNKSSANSGVMAANVLNKSVLETVSSSSEAKITRVAKLRSATANSNSGTTTSSSAQMTLQSRGQL